MAHIYNAQLDAFTLYHLVQEEQSAQAAPGPILPALGHAVAGSAGTAISNIIVYPLDLVITRLQAQRQLRKDAPSTAGTTSTEDAYGNFVDALRQIYNNEGGIKAFYAGVVPDTAKSVADAFLFFLAYTFLRQKRVAVRTAQTPSATSITPPPLPVIDELGVGMLAGAFAKFFTTPIQQIVTRKQTESMNASTTSPSSQDPRNRKSMRAIAREIRDQKGLTGFWAGYSASIVLTINPALTFAFQNLLSRLIIPSHKRADPGARRTFLIAAISKALASSITYPVSLAKTRAQLSSSPAMAPTEEAKSIKLDEDAAREEGSLQAGASGLKGLAEDNIPSLSSSEEGKTKNPRTRLHLRLPPLLLTLQQILQTEGPAALYSGLLGEVLKGFFSHGITMLLKQRIHSLIISLYYVVQATLREIKVQAARKTEGVTVQSVANDTKDAVEDVVGDVVDEVEGVARDAKDMIWGTGEKKTE